MPEITNTQKTISQLYIDKAKYNLQPSYQRGSVWSRDMQQYLLDSILRGYDLPKLYLAKPGEKASQGVTYDVVDGQQRLTAIFAFLDGELELGDTSGKEKIRDTDLSGLKYGDLPELFSTIITGFTLSIAHIEDATKDEIRDIFLRLQEGKTLNPAERRNAIDCKLGDSIRRLAKHKFFVSKISSKDSRFSHCDWIAHVACLVANGGPHDVSSDSLSKFYKASKSGTLNEQSIEAEVKSTLNLMLKAFPDNNVPELNVKWGFVDLFLLFWTLKSRYVVSDVVCRNLAEFYKRFELERRKIKGDPEELLSPSYAGEINGRQMFDYREKFVREGMKKESIYVRSKVYFQAFVSRHAELQLKDTKRAFDRDERLVIWRLSDEKCSACGLKISFQDAEADHIHAYSNGGETSLQNAQCLCVTCNRSKGAN